MKFNTKWDFKEAVREYTIQEERRIKFKKNDRKRVRTICKVKECKWVIYASRDYEDSCWQVKTFMDDHTCPREDKNRDANRNWVASKLVKKVRKYPNFRHYDVTTFFKTKYDLSLNRNSISRALSDTRNVVYGDEKAQYAMLRDYGLTLLKTNSGSTVQICTTPQPHGDQSWRRYRIWRPNIVSFGQDANHHIYVIAWTIVNVENKDNWKWFLELLHQDLRDYKTHGWCFIFDMQKSGSIMVHGVKVKDCYGESLCVLTHHGYAVSISVAGFDSSHKGGDV
ncbi:uncharacterized protein LOC107615743 [Arachis ipaensis]|uniref:uncharacterized protein LOC107615743 n=1 Tax=Arachis ipaensis TaxID=130454 RepID=UPI0007AF01C8|nr:uncharacterized protein LOC107615743 [Arachis ipaensis]XP_025678716.1 uncharacterized protein LOC112778630 [Arachis hypogaea]